LKNRTYPAGEIEIQEVMAENSYFTRYLVRYPSDGLMIYGFMNVPVGDGPFPIIIALHGYIDPAIYNTLDYTTHYADALARSGYLVLHPNLRGYPPSDEGENLFRVGMAIDVLNLLAIIRDTGGADGPLDKGDPEQIGMWGHSMGGGITTRVITLSPDVKAAVLYGAMSGDEKQNFEAIFRWSDGARGAEELSASEEWLAEISPVNFFSEIAAAVSIHHGRADELVPLAWSVQTCDALRGLGHDVECFYYDGMPHTFYGEGDALFIQNTRLFFDRFLKDQ
jgi:dipeptidyl aminopeptidase/acylaminoacyl peptidase